MAPPAWHSQKKSLLSFLTNFFHVFNIVLFTSGCGLIAVAVWTWLYMRDYIILVTTAVYFTIPWLLSLAGALSMIAAIIGSYAASRQNKCLLVLYIFSVVLILAVELMTGVLAWVYRDKVTFDLGNSLAKTFADNYNISPEHTEAIDSMQQQYKCCGASSFEEWQDKAWLRGATSKNVVPDSCCKSVSPGCGESYHPSNIPYTGCMHKLSDELQQQLVVVFASSLGIAAVPIVGIVLACAIYLKTRDRSRYDGYTRGATQPAAL